MTRLFRLFRRRKPAPPTAQVVAVQPTAELLAAVQRELARMPDPDPMPPPSTLVPEDLAPRLDIPPLPRLQIPRPCSGRPQPGDPGMCIYPR